jgi:hypothetical protein
MSEESIVPEEPVEPTEPVSSFIPPEQWGQDHWSLLGYVNVRYAGSIPLELDHMRCNFERHPLLVGFRQSLVSNTGTIWKTEYSTRLRGNTRENPVRAAGHDDWDCLDDLEAAGLVDVISLVNGLVFLTEKGQEVANRLVRHKAQGGKFATFEL